MSHFNPQTEIAPRVLATDLDGTLIPLPDHPENRDDLKELSRKLDSAETPLIFATGRHFESVLEAIEDYALPLPDWLVCDVGSAIYQRKGNHFEAFAPYADHLRETARGVDRDAIIAALRSVEALELQASDHQQRFKISYQTGPQDIEAAVEAVEACLSAAGLPYDCMGSLDPFLNIGLLDVMPRGVSKAYALIWLSTHADFAPDEVIYSGDSGNDLAALASGFRAIIVANASPGLAEKVKTALAGNKIEPRVYESLGHASTGVLEGCRHFGLFNPRR